MAAQRRRLRSKLHRKQIPQSAGHATLPVPSRAAAEHAEKCQWLQSLDRELSLHLRTVKKEGPRQDIICHH